MLQRRILKYQIETHRSHHHHQHQPIPNFSNNNNHPIVEPQPQQQQQQPQSQPQQPIPTEPSPTISSSSSTKSEEFLSFQSASTLSTVNSYTTASDSVSEGMSEPAFASPTPGNKAHMDGADYKPSKPNMPPPPPPRSINTITTSSTTSTVSNNNENGHDDAPKWSLLHNRMKGIDDKLDPLKRGSVLIEHLSEMHKLATSQVISGEEYNNDQNSGSNQDDDHSTDGYDHEIEVQKQLEQVKVGEEEHEIPQVKIESVPVDNITEASNIQKPPSTPPPSSSASSTPPQNLTPSIILTSTTSTTSTTTTAPTTPLSSSSPQQPSEAIVMSGINLFNDKPKKGIEYFFACKLLQKTPESISEFLHTCPLLNKRSIGDYLGESDPFSISILEAFIARFNFQDLDFDMALRQLLYTFRLPGEAQKIDRIMQKFANQYFKDNIKSGIFEDPDSVYVLAFAVILLNTDVHSPAIKHSMTKVKFVKSLAKINNGKDFPQEFIEDLYDRIFADEIKMDPTQAKFPYAVKKGWLNIRVKGKVTEKWSRKWCILSEGSLYFFRKPSDNTPTRYLHPDTVITPKKEVKGKKHCFMVNHSSPPLLMELLQQQQIADPSKSGKNMKITQQWVYQQMLIMSSANNKKRDPRFWDAVAEKYTSEQIQQQMLSMQSISATDSGSDILDSDSVSSMDSLSESSAFYEEEVSSISSSSSSPNSPLSTSIPQNNNGANYLGPQPTIDPKKKGFSLRLNSKQKKEMSEQQALTPPPTTANPNNSPRPVNQHNQTPNHSLTQPRPTLYKNGSGSLLRSSSISTFSTPTSQQTTPHLNTSSSSTSSTNSTPGSNNSVSSSASSSSKPSPSSTLMAVIESSPQQIESLMKLQQKMIKTSKQTTVLLCTDSKREMESWTRLILSQFQKQHQPIPQSNNK